MSSPRMIALALLLAVTSAVKALPPGLYYDPDRNGHGFDLQPLGGRWVMVFYSYDVSGLPVWYLGTLEEDDRGRLTGELALFDYQAGRQPPQQIVRGAGSVSVDPERACGEAGSGAVFEWSLEGETGSWCVVPLLDQDTVPAADYTGLWYAGEEDQGWGISLDFMGPDAATTEVAVLFYFDAEGQARWALGAGQGGPEAEIALQNFRGYCRTCPPQSLEAANAGSLSHRLQVVDGWPGGEIELDADYAFAPGGTWQRTASPLLPLSEPAPNLIPLADRIEPSRATAFVNVTVIPMTEEGTVLDNRTVVVQDQRIVAIGRHGAVAIPDAAVRIDGRGLYLGPGLQDMHTHFSFGGVTAMQEAGLLFVANGVTTVLNMGDSGTQDLPGTDRLFGSGALMGPAVYAGLIAYGPGDGRAASLTISDVSQVRPYVERGLSQGYDYIKIYNQLSPPVIERFMEEGRRLDIPVIGHLPKQISMQSALDQGQRMIAHVAEVYFTLLGNQPREDLLPMAADLINDHGVYLTDTLTASESCAAMFGGNEANFDSFSRREGVQYQPTSFLRGWRNFFESATIQPPGSRPGQLDDRLVFFKQMVRFLNDAGVPLILGTDSPGHVGVISGFSVHENLRLYDEIGLSPFDAYAAASRNPGQFFDDTLAPELTWGTVEVGKRADLVLVEGNPLNDVAHLKRPLGVMTRGRFYSRELLQAELDKLDAKYPGPFLSNR